MKISKFAKFEVNLSRRIYLLSQNIREREKNKQRRLYEILS